MTKAALERFSTGLASEVYANNVAVNALSPNRVVADARHVFHAISCAPRIPTSRRGRPRSWPKPPWPSAVSRPRTRTGRIAYSQDLLNELGITVNVAGSSELSS